MRIISKRIDVFSRFLQPIDCRCFQFVQRSHSLYTHTHEEGEIPDESHDHHCITGCTTSRLGLIYSNTMSFAGLESSFSCSGKLHWPRPFSSVYSMCNPPLFFDY